MRTHFILVTHALTDWNVEGRIQGHTDTPLNAKGREMANRLASCLEQENISAIYTSDLKRAYETAVPLSKIKSLKINRDLRLREGRSRHQEVSSKYPMLPFPAEVEEEQDVWERMNAALTAIGRKNVGKTILAVSHGAAVEIFITRILESGGKDPLTYLGIRNALNHIYYQDGLFRCGNLNQKDHLLEY